MKDFSFTLEALHSAFQAVKENHGCAGADGITIEQFDRNLEVNLRALLHQLNNFTYSPFPLIKILVDKCNGEARKLCVPTVRDRIVQTAFLRFIEPILEKEFEHCSYAYRKGHSVKQAVYKIKEYYDNGFRWIVDADIDAFFDSVDHNILLTKCEKCIPFPYMIHLIELWLKVEVWDGKTLSVMQKGIPQGSPISPILANLFLDEFDEALLQHGHRVIRYSDDFVILCKDPNEAMVALGLSKSILEKLLLVLDEEQITGFEKGFTFLGVTFFKSMITVPFDKKKKVRRILFYPKPLNNYQTFN